MSVPVNPASQYVTSYGSQIGYVYPAPAVGVTLPFSSYTKIGQTVDLESPQSEIGDLKITNNDSPNGGNPNGSHEYAPGMTEPGDVEIKVVYYKGGHEAILNLQGDGKIYGFQELYTDGTVCSFPGYWKGAGIKGKTEDGNEEGSIKIKLSSPAIWS